MMIVAILVALLLLVFWAVGARGRLATLRTAQRSAFARIDEQLRHRYELIPALVETVGGHLPDQRAELEQLIQARNAAVAACSRAAADPGEAGATRALMEAEAQLAAGMARVSQLSRSVPGLADNGHRAEIDAELTSTEHRLVFARQGYNDAVAAYNRALQQFPSSILARLSGLRPVAPLLAALSPIDRRQGRAGF